MNTVCDRDWPEDFEHENGNYMNTCCECRNTFTGHKRRFICKACSTSQGGAAVEVVAHLVLGGMFHGGSGPELGDIDYQIEVGVAERLQLENVKTAEDVQLELMTVAQHRRILAAATHPADQVADLGAVFDSVRELIREELSHAYHERKTTDEALDAIRALLASLK